MLHFTDGCKSVMELYESMNKMRKMVQNVYDQMTAKSIDAILFPANPMPAPQHFVPAKILRTMIVLLYSCYLISLFPANEFYTSFTNFTDFVSGVVPVTKESREDQKLLNENYPEDDWVLKKTKQVSSFL